MGLISFHKKIEDNRTIGASKIKYLYKWVDAEQAVNPDIKFHTGGTMSMGWVTINCRSGKRNINMNRSTDAELVRTSD